MNAPIDLRSDTVTRPSAAMRAAMAKATVGDDVFGDDPTVQQLERKVAELVGKQAGLFVPSGTMANQLAIRLHCRSGDEAIVHAGSHIMNYEGGAAAALWGVTLRAVRSDDGSLPVDQVAAALHTDADHHLAPTRLVCFENTHNGCGGVVVEPGRVAAVAALVRPHGIALHLDGARLANAAVASGRSLADAAAPFDTVSLCLSKGLGAPVGSVLSGTAEAIARARHWRKRLGGGMRQVGILAAAGLYALDHNLARLADDHARARRLAEAIAAEATLCVDVPKVQTNLVFFDVAPACAKGRAMGDLRVHLTQALRDHGLWVAGGAYRLRAVTHLDVDDAALDRAIAILQRVARELR
ncbi:MAG: low-specificity L-threonine aldolase [Deltaproteobacteria bacterium]|nr:low-specificity L-threonine aldolase [Deltaproteobacteria bacterium]